MKKIIAQYVNEFPVALESPALFLVDLAPSDAFSSVGNQIFSTIGLNSWTIFWRQRVKASPHSSRLLPVDYCSMSRGCRGFERQEWCSKWILVMRNKKRFRGVFVTQWRILKTAWRVKTGNAYMQADIFLRGMRLSIEHQTLVYKSVKRKIFYLV